MSILATSVSIRDCDGENWIEGEPALIQVERSDNNEVSLNLKVRGDLDPVTYISLELREAQQLVLSLAAAASDE